MGEPPKLPTGSPAKLPATGDMSKDLDGLMSSLIGEGAIEKLQGYQKDDTAFKAWVMETLTAIAGGINNLNRKLDQALAPK